jgi:putative PEP-CTERM system TPR-repeat lipoprotein
MSFIANSGTAEDYEKALISFNQEEFRESYIYLKNALQRTPGHLPSKLLIGRIFLIDGYPEAAITEFEEVVQAGADINLVVLPLANAYLIKGQFEKIIELDIPQNANRATQLDIYLLKANAFIQQDKYILAENQFKRAKEIFGNDIRVINGLAQMALLNKNFTEARRIVIQALAINPPSAISKLISGLIYQSEKEYGNALIEFEAAYQNAPDDPAIIRALANSYAQSGNIVKASELVNEIEAKNLDGFQTKLLKARLLAMSEKSTEADVILSELSQTLSFINKSDKQYVSKVSLVAGITAHLNQNYGVSTRELSRYLNNQEPTAELVAMLAEGYIRTNNIKEASELLERHENLIIDNIQIASLSCDLYLSSNKVFKCDSLVQQLKQRHGEAEYILLLEAKLLNRRKRPSEALDILQTKLANNKSINTLLFRTSLLASLGRFNESLIDAKALLSTSPDKLTYLNLNIDLFIRLEEFEQANVLLEKVFQQDPNSLAGLINQSRIRFAFTDLQGADASIQKVLALDKSNFSALLLSGQILVKQNRLDDAINQLIGAKTVDANSTSPLELLVSIYKQQNRLDLAISVLDQLLKLRRLEPKYIYEKAKIFLALKESEKAKRELDILFFQWAEQPENLVQLSRLQMKNNDIEGAETSLKIAQQQAPNYLIIQLEYAELLLAKKVFSEADTYIKKLQNSFPDNANVSLVKGHYFKETGDLEYAYKYYYKAYSLSNNFTAALIELYKLASQGVHRIDIMNIFDNLIETQPEANFSRHLYADLLFKEGEITEARKHYEKLILVDGLPNKANIYNNLANIVSDSDIAKAMFYSKEAVNLNPNSSSILDTQGWLFTKNNNLEQGLNILRQAFTLNSDNPTIRFHIAFTLNKLGRAHEARSELELALLSDQEFQERVQAQTLLSDL